MPECPGTATVPPLRLRRRRQAMTVENTTPQFDERAVERIRASLPKRIDQRRLKLLSLVLDEWIRTELREHLSRESRATSRKRYAQLSKFKRCANSLQQVLEATDQRGMSWIAQEMAREDGNELFSVSHEKLTEMKKRLKDEGGKLAAATARVIDELDESLSGRRPRNIRAYLVMLDLAAIFEWLTDRKAARGVNRTYHTESGPFWRFAESVWLVAFGSIRGLKAAMKNWAEARKLYRERSMLLYNMAAH